jgi:post-segregation antitoxin (ccd killing protein)
MNEFSSKQYNQDEVNRIIRRALKITNEDTISHQDLIETAREIGIDSKILEAAIEQEQRNSKKEKIRKARLEQRKTAFYSHLWRYLIITAVLLLINIFTPGPWWFQWAVLGWGIGMAFHFKAIYFPHGKRFEKTIRSRHNKGGFTASDRRRIRHCL